MTEDRPRVFIPQHPSKFDAATRESVNDGDLSGVMAFGHPIFILPRGKIKYGQLQRTVRWMENMMFDFSPRDYLVAVGDPVVIQAAGIIAFQHVGPGVPINVIRWLRQTNEFKVFPLFTGGRHVQVND